VPAIFCELSLLEYYTYQILVQPKVSMFIVLWALSSSPWLC